jgi:hypothetical protein
MFDGRLRTAEKPRCIQNLGIILSSTEYLEAANESAASFWKYLNGTPPPGK